jgi:hypothetical protein
MTEKTTPTFQKGFVVILAPRESLSMAGRAWNEALATAEGEGYRVTSEGAIKAALGYCGYDVPPDFCALRQIHSAIHGDIAGLWLQNW